MQPLFAARSLTAGETSHTPPYLRELVKVAQLHLARLNILGKGLEQSARQGKVCRLNEFVKLVREAAGDEYL